ncbi:hypothetical protein [Xanthomonas theicola]|uniref:hypothetical protein n=1 Tax=Xanthomonas theicola TaxID=56464 RepID=UPI000FF886C9|nr:hypothetical protein [Xanthomonas theicola]QNH24776.1 hypothetical protein G4Q83_08500 [Xanthomonas theicola]
MFDDRSVSVSLAASPAAGHRAGCVVGIAAGLAAGFHAWWQLGDSGVPGNGGHGLVALLLAVLTAIGYSVSFLVPR